MGKHLRWAVLSELGSRIFRLFATYVQYFIPLIALGNVHLVNDRTLNLNNGDKLLLWCTDRNLSAFPNPKSLAWSKDNVHIPSHDPRLNTGASNSILLIEQLRENDEGVYNCTVEAQAFLSINITRLRVYGRELLFSGSISFLLYFISVLLLFILFIPSLFIFLRNDCVNIFQLVIILPLVWELIFNNYSTSARWMWDDR